MITGSLSQNNCMHYLTVDGMLSGTGIRNSVAGGYIDPSKLGISRGLIEKINQWLIRYERSHYNQFTDKNENKILDQEGLKITKQLQNELPGSKIEYYSSAELRKFAL